MKKTVLQFVILCCAFFALWYLLSLFPWRNRLHISEFNAKKEARLSELILKTYGSGREEINKAEINNILDKIKTEICVSNKIDTATIHLHVFKDREVNAFTVPMGHIIINTALIGACDNPEMLAGVIAHEIAHSRLNHIGKRLATQIGLATLVNLAGDNSGIILRLIHTLSSSGFDRRQEDEADRTAVQYLQKAHIDIMPMGVFLNKLAAKEESMPDALEWVSTHPNPGKRAKKIFQYKSSDQTIPLPVSDSAWQLASRTADIPF